tara:strand:- start:74 stop:340 length:267 start_codon:yes stop_codon:yes gene_type:complete
MRVNGKVNVDVEITPKELVSALKSEVYERLCLPNPKQGRVYVKDGRWEIQTVAHTTHSFEIEEALGRAIEEDVEVFDAFHTIAEFLRD